MALASCVLRRLRTIPGVFYLWVSAHLTNGRKTVTFGTAHTWSTYVYSPNLGSGYFCFVLFFFFFGGGGVRGFWCLVWNRFAGLVQGKGFCIPAIYPRPKIYRVAPDKGNIFNTRIIYYSRISGCDHLSSATSFSKYQKFQGQITIWNLL